MKIEFRNSGQKNKTGIDIYYLYINNKTDKFGYDSEGMGCFIVSEAARITHLKKLKLIRCKDLPDEMNLWNIVKIDASPGKINTFEIVRDGNNIRTFFNLGFKNDRTEGYKNYFLNPYRLYDKIIKNAAKSGVKVEYMGNEEPMDDLIFEFVYGLSGTFGDRLDEGCKVILKIVEQSEQENVAEGKKFLKNR